MQDTCCNDKKSCACTSTTLHRVGSAVFALPLFIFGVFHFMQAPTMAGMLAGWPFALFLVYLSGAGLILSAVAIVLNRYTRLAALLLAGELGIFILTLHLPVILAGGEGVQAGVMYALKDLAILGGALVLASHATNRGFSAK